MKTRIKQMASFFLTMAMAGGVYMGSVPIICDAQSGEMSGDEVHYAVNFVDGTDKVSRALVWNELAKLNGVDVTCGASWYSEGRDWAIKQGISDGTEPTALVTREQLLTMLYRYKGNPDVSGNLSAFPDASSVSPWAADAVLWATSTGLIKGMDGYINPRYGATIEQLEILITRLGGSESQTHVSIQQLSPGGNVVKETGGTQNAELVVDKYGENDRLVFEIEGSDFLWIKAGSDMPEHLIYIPKGRFEFVVPSGKELECYDSKNFNGKQIITARTATADDLKSYRNLAANILDVQYKGEKNNSDAQLNSLPENSAAVEKGEVTGYPHAYANRVTRNDSWFYARNAIDGISEENSHGPYPYQSWGGGKYEDLTFTVYFGRDVYVDKVKLAQRSDYTVKKDKEHDTYWKEVVIEFSDGSEITINPVKGGQLQSFEFEKKKTRFVRLKKLVPYEEPKSNMYAALNEIEVWGYDA